MTEKKQETQVTHVVSTEEARQLLVRDQQQRSDAFDRELIQLQNKYGYRLVAVPGLTAEGRVVASIQKQQWEA